MEVRQPLVPSTTRRQSLLMSRYMTSRRPGNRLLDAGGPVVIVFRQGGIGRGSGVRSERDFFGVYDLNDSKVIRYRQYESRREALEAAGLSE